MAIQVSYNGVRDTLVTAPTLFRSSAYNNKNNTTFIIDAGTGKLQVTNHTQSPTSFFLTFDEKSDSSSPNYNNNYSFVYSVATFDDFVLIGAFGYKYNANVEGVGTAYILKYNNGWPQTVTTNDRLFPDTISADNSSLTNLYYGSNVQLFNHDSKTWAAVSTGDSISTGKAIYLFTKDSNDTWSLNHKVEPTGVITGWSKYWNFAGDMLYVKGVQNLDNYFYKYNSSSGWEYSFESNIEITYGYVSKNYFMSIPSNVDNTVQIHKINDTKTDLVAETVFSAVTSVQNLGLSLSISDTAAIYTDNRKSSGIKILKNDNDTWSEVSITYNQADPNLDGSISRPLVTNNNISYIEANPTTFPTYQHQAFIVLNLDGGAPVADTTAPAFSSASVVEGSATNISITFDEDIADNASVSAGDFAVAVGGSSATISSASVSSGKVVLVLDARVYQGQAVTVSYTKSSTGGQNIADSAGNAVDSFSNESVTNDTTTAVPTTSTSEEETALSNLSVGDADIQVLKTGGAFSVSNGKSTLDDTRKNKLKSIIDGATDATDKRKKRRTVLKLLFAQELTLTKMVIPKEDLQLPSGFTKTKALVVKAGESFNINELGTDEGFYSVLDDGETIAITTDNTTLTFDRQDVGDNELYTVSATTWTDIVINSDNVSTGTFTDSNNTGTLAPDDSVTIDGRIFIIGSIADGGGSGGSAGDPYVFPIKSSIPVKLPNKNAFYRMFEQGDNYINVEVGRCTDDHKNRMLDYAKKLTPVTHNIVMDGYFYQNVFISAEGHQLAINYNTKKGNCDDEAMKFFKIKQSKKLFDCDEFYEDANCWSITWDTKENKKIQVELMFFPNPHIENGINIIPSTLKKSTGLIVDNYKPKLMELPSLTKEKFNKLHRRLSKCKKYYQKMSIKSKNEKWHFN